MLYLVLPYLTSEVSKNKTLFRDYDDVFVPAEIMGAHYKAAVGLRNRWMVDHSDVLIAYVRRNYGGASQTLEYAKNRAGVKIVNIAGNRQSTALRRF